MRSFPDLPGHSQYPWRDPQYLLDGSVVMRSSLARDAAENDLAALTTQVMTSVAVVLQVGDVVTRIAFRSGATAAVTPTNWWFALYDDAATPALLAQTADQLTAAWAAATTQDLLLQTAQTITRSGVYYAACMVKATTLPTLVGATLGNAGVSSGLVTGQKALAQTSGSALLGVAPATIATPTAVATVPLCVLR